MEQDAAMTVGPVYRDIAERTGGEMYVGVVGPVRTGKSTLIAGLMEQMVLPFMEKGAKRERLTDELPQSGSGRTVTTTQPAFIPGEGAARIDLGDGLTARVRLVDSVGYLIPGALGTQEGDAARMVSTPWSDADMPFEEAAALGTQEQSEEFVRTLTDACRQDPQSLWDTNFFGKSLKDLIREGVTGKLSRMPADTQEKVQSALTRMLNEGEGGMICILL